MNKPTQFQNRMRAADINSMCEDDKSMHIFYTLEEIEDVVKCLHKVLRSDDPFIGQKITALENIASELIGIQDRAETFNKKNPLVLNWCQNTLSPGTQPLRSLRSGKM